MASASDGESRALVARLLGEQIDGAAGAALERLLADPAGEPAAAGPPAPRPPDAYDPVLDRAAGFARSFASALAAEAPGARAAWEELAALPPAERPPLVARRPAYQTWGLFNLLLETAGRVAGGDPREAAHLAKLALEILGHLDHPCLTASGREDLRASALRSLAGAELLAGDVSRANRTHLRAWAAFDRGSGDLLERARLLELRALVRAAAGDPIAAVRAIEVARGVYSRLKERGLEGRALFLHARLVGHRDPRLGVELVSGALARIDAEADPRAALSARHLHAWLVNDLGRPEEALALATELRPLYARFGEEAVFVQRRWLEGRILRDLGYLDEAEEKLRAALHLLAEVGAVEDLIACGLDLLLACGLAGREDRIVDVDLAIRGVLGSWGEGSEALAAWTRAVEGAADRRTVREAAALFRERALRAIPPRGRSH